MEALVAEALVAEQFVEWLTGWLVAGAGRDVSGADVGAGFIWPGHARLSRAPARRALAAERVDRLATWPAGAARGNTPAGGATTDARPGGRRRGRRLAISWGQAVVHLSECRQSPPTHGARAARARACWPR